MNTEPKIRNSSGKFQVGKLPHKFLQKLLSNLPILHKNVVIEPKIGEDSAALDLGEEYLVVASDPITFTARDIGFYLVVINANDIAVTGARPSYLLVTLLLPEGTTDEGLVKSVFDSISAACRKWGISVIGGHTEVTYGLDRPIAVGTMLGFAPKDGLIRTGGAKVGDIILLTKGIAIEGTSVIAKERKEELAKVFGNEFVERAVNFTLEPGISVVEDALTAAQTRCVNSMHDPTEGGLAAALYEIAEASGVGVTVTFESIPIYDETRKICEFYGLDPLGLLASGALLITTPRACVEKVKDALRAKGISVSQIGHVTPKERGLKLLRDGKECDLPLYHRDELTKAI